MKTRIVENSKLFTPQVETRVYGSSSWSNLSLRSSSSYAPAKPIRFFNIEDAKDFLDIFSKSNICNPVKTKVAQQKVVFNGSVAPK